MIDYIIVYILHLFIYSHLVLLIPFSPRLSVLDLHLTDYKKVAVELSTHSIGGLTENDFIVAAKIDQIAPKAKSA